MSLYLHDDTQRTANRLIFVTGVGRSGTTMLGRIIHSMEGVEYGCEPPMLFTIMQLVRELPEPDFRLLFEACLHEDLLMGQVTARAMNRNPADESCVFTAKTQEEIAARQSRAWTKATSRDVARAARLCVKMPDVASLLVDVQRLYPGMEVVVIHREGNAVINSALKLRWWADDTLEHRDIVWPSRNPAGRSIPWFVEDDRMEWWQSASELERAAYYYVQSLAGLDRISNPIILSYEHMMADPAGTVHGLASRLGLRFGPVTPSLIEGVQERTKQETDWIAQLPTALADRVREASRFS
jgi:hypothetical protein